MPITKISPKHQITIPKEAFERLRLEVGDFLEVEVTEEGLLLIPKKLISKDQAWFWTNEWQAKEKEADEAIARGTEGIFFLTLPCIYFIQPTSC